jgi:hypothetical protein
MTPPNYDWAETLFIQLDHTIKQVAAKTGTDEALIQKWATENEWEAKRRSMLTTKKKQLDRMYQLLDIVSARIKKDGEKATLHDADLMIKYTTAINKLETEASIGQIIEVAKLYTTWLIGKDLAFCKLVTASLDEFIKQHL